jgi:hypothetical protein
MPSPFENPWQEVSFAIQDMVRQGLKGVERTHLPNYAEYAVEKHHEKPQSARGDH